MDGTGDSKIGAAIPRTRASMGMFVPARTGSSIERTHYAERAAIHDVRGDHRRRHVLVAKHALNCANGRARLQEVGGDLGPVASCHLVELSAQSVADPYRQQRRAIVTSFAATHHDLVALEVDILDPQRQAFEPSETTPIEHFRDEAEERIESFEEGLDLAAREDRREVLGSTGALQALQGRHFQGKDALGEEDDGAKGLVLSRGRDATLHGEMVQEGRGFEGTHFSGVAAVVEAEERADPVEVGLFGAGRLVQSAARVSHGFEEGSDEVSTRAAEMLRGWCRFSRGGATGSAGARGGARCAQDGRGGISRGLEWIGLNRCAVAGIRVPVSS